MRKAIVFFTALVVALGLAAPDPNVGAEIIRPLTEAKKAMLGDPVAAVQRIEKGQQTLDELLKRLDAPPALREAIKQAYAEAVIAAGRRSAANLDSRIWLVRGLVGKRYYEAVYQALSEGDTKAAQRYLEALIQAVVMDRATAKKARALVLAKDPEGLRRLLERAFADRIARSLRVAEVAKERPAAYAAAAKAYGLYFVVQDSPTFATVGGDEFLAALKSLTEGDEAAFKERVASLRQRFRAVVKRIDLGQPLPTQAFLPKATPAAPPVPQGSGLRPRREAANPTFATPRWLDPARRKILVALATTMGYNYVSDFVGRITQAKTALGAATASLASGNFDAARQHIGDAAWTYVFYLSPLFEVADANLDAQIRKQIVRLQTISGLRTSDLTVLTNALNAMEERFFKGTPPPRSTAFQLTLLNLAGPPRTAMFLLAGLMSLLPLYLTRRVFAQRAAYWRALGVALALLLLPAITEALGYVGEYLAARGFSAAAGLVSLSIFQSLSAQMAWGILIIAVVLTATWGLAGVAMQFGALPTLRLRRRAATTTSAPAAEAELEEIDWE